MKGKKMSEAKTVEISTIVKNGYAKLAGSTRDQMVKFVQKSADEIIAGRVSLRVGRASIKEAIKQNGAVSDISASSFDYMVTASLALNLEGAEAQTVKSILKVSARLHKLIGAEEAQNEVIKAKSWDALVADLEESEATVEEAEEAEAVAEEADILANGITLESVIDGIDAYLKAQSLTDLKTTELAKLESVISRLIGVAKNTKAVA
jgi:hypothetical protein